MVYDSREAISTVIVDVVRDCINTLSETDIDECVRPHISRATGQSATALVEPNLVADASDQCPWSFIAAYVKTFSRIRVLTGSSLSLLPSLNRCVTPGNIAAL